MSYLAIHAQDFLNAYKILRESNDALIRKEVRETEGENEAAYGKCPAMGIDIVCLAFSVELHLKELHRVVSEKIPRGHNILKLFQSLPKSVKTEILSHQSIAQYGLDDAQMERGLLSISDSFEKWRYAYESTTLRYDISYAEALIEALRFVASKRAGIL